jgi:hypothetical protein
MLTAAAIADGIYGNFDVAFVRHVGVPASRT